MHIHILGICGTFMGGLAVLAKQAGHVVTGCDANVYPPMSTQLREQGIELIEGFDPDQLKSDIDLYVIGNVISRGNPLMEELLNRGLPYCSGPQWMGDNILNGKWVLAVAGTHGKTTTSAMLAWILQDAGFEPGFLIGGVPNNFGLSARLGGHANGHGESATPMHESAMTALSPNLSPASGREERSDSLRDFRVKEPSNFFVIEADEYDSAFFDKRSKFVHYRAKTAILNNLEYDHADIFPDLAAIETQFHHLVRTVPGIGQLVVNGQEPALQRVLDKGCWSEQVLFGTKEGWHFVDDEVRFNDHAFGILNWNLQGEHNRQNALAAIAAAHHVGIAPEQSLNALSRFDNVKRRMEVRGVVNNITVYDDFAHHPTAIATTIAGLRKKVGSARILAVLEPRSNTMKLGSMKAALPGSLNEADLIFAYGAANGKDAIGWDLAASLAPLGNRATSFNDLSVLQNALLAEAKPGDHILMMSNGGFGGIHQKVVNGLAQR